MSHFGISEQKIHVPYIYTQDGGNYSVIRMTDKGSVSMARGKHKLVFRGES
jgi:hypothetical protein